MSYEPPAAPFDARQLVGTMAKLSRLRGRQSEAALLEAAAAHFAYDGYDNFQEGTHFYRLILRVPLEAYADVEDDLTTVERTLLERLEPLTRKAIGYRISSVVLDPDETIVGLRREGAECGPRLWPDHSFRLFLTHLSRTKGNTSQLRKALCKYYIAAFVAHDDLIPSLDWRKEIQRALRSMDALAALITEDFVSSPYCDQEVGFAMGAEKLVLPVKMGADPHGFIGAQAIQGLGQSPAHLAEAIFNALLINELTRYRMVDILVGRLENATSWETVRTLVPLIESAQFISPNHLTRLEAALANNEKISTAFYNIPNRIRQLCASRRAAA